MNENIDKKLLNNIKIALNTYIKYENNPILDFLKDNTDEMLDLSRKFYNELKIFNGKRRKYYKNYLTINDVLNLSKEFLSVYFPQYLSEFDKLLNNGSFNLIDKDSEGYDENDKDINHNFCEAFIDNKDIKYNLNIVITHTLKDSFVILHEFFHYINGNNKIVANDRVYSTKDRWYYTECLSRFIEYLFYDFLKSKEEYKDDNIKMIEYLIDADADAVDDLGYSLYLISKMRDVNYSDFYKDDLLSVKKYKVKFELNKINQEKEKDINREQVLKNELNDIENQEKIMIDALNKTLDGLKYSICIMLAVIMYYNYKNGIINLKNIETFNNKIRYKNDLHSVNYILSEEFNDKLLMKALNYLKDDIENHENTKLLK